jgi:hypothetical protein
MDNVKGLTACAGIAYIKDSYPFHYGINLAEELTGEAKKHSKSKNIQGKVGNDTIPSSLSFYKVQASFTDDLSEMKKRTHCAEHSGVNFDYGPYFMDEIDSFVCIKELDDKLEILQKHKKDKSKGISKLRQYISELYKDKYKAKFMMDRMSTINESLYKDLKLNKEVANSEVESRKSILNDLIQLHTFKEAYNEN